MKAWLPLLFFLPIAAQAHEQKQEQLDLHCTFLATFMQIHSMPADIKRLQALVCAFTKITDSADDCDEPQMLSTADEYERKAQDFADTYTEVSCGQRPRFHELTKERRPTEETDQLLLEITNKYLTSLKKRPDKQTDEAKVKK